LKIKVLSDELNYPEKSLEVIFIINKNLKHKWVKDEDLLRDLGFKGENDEIILLPESSRLYVGIKSLKDREGIRITSSKALKHASNYSYKNLIISQYNNKNGSLKNTKAILEGMLLGSYKFDKYKSEKKNISIENIYITQEEYFEENLLADFIELENIISRVEKITDAVNYTRDLVNTPPNEIQPQTMTEIAIELANINNLEIDILDETRLQEEGMELFLSVGKASVNPPSMVHLSYLPKNAKAKIALIGKGLTYDSGGLSLKPANFMTTMKSDKSGASAVLGILKAISELKLPVEVHGFLGLAENMIGGNAYKPDDIIRAKNGTTVEIGNTDAEGRLVLADTLSYAQENIEDLDYVVDIATLTGAAVVGVGEFTNLVMGHNRFLKEKIVKEGNKSGEIVATLPFNRHLKELLKSNIADVSNIASSRYGGALTAGLFLDYFIEKQYKEKWLHVDIAGPAFVEKEWGYNPAGGSGAGVRMLIRWLESLTKKESFSREEEK
jgi:leucyl aminopeptidase